MVKITRAMRDESNRWHIYAETDSETFQTAAQQTEQFPAGEDVLYLTQAGGAATLTVCTQMQARLDDTPPILELPSLTLPVESGAEHLRQPGRLLRLSAALQGRAHMEACATLHALRRPSSRPRELPAYIRFKSDNLHGAVVRSFANAQRWEEDEASGLDCGMRIECSRTTVAIGLQGDKRMHWQTLRERPERLVKAHYALWARWYEDGGQPGAYVKVELNQFCSDMGYARHHKGGYRREHKQEVVRLLEALTAVEIRLIYTPPGSSRAIRIRGPLWQCGFLAEEGDRNHWSPIGITCAPGPWFMDPHWMKYNQAIGKIGSGLMRLANDRDGWAILIGGYLGALMRTNGYKPLRLRAETVLNAAGLASKSAIHAPEKYLGKFERALDRLQEVGVIAAWRWADAEAEELSDPDNPDAVAGYYAHDPYPSADWTNCVVEIVLPAELEDEGRALRARRSAKRLTGRR